MVPRIGALFMWLASVLSARTPCGPADCAEVLCMGLTDAGMHTLHLSDDQMSLKCICNSITRGGGWIVFQVREVGKVSFSRRSWEEYKEGFGNDREYWLGNEFVHRLTRGREMILLVEMEDRHGDRMYAQYDGFSIGDEESGYKLMLGSYLTAYSTAGDLLSSQRNISFKTCYRSNAGNACAEAACEGGWWYDNCNASGFLNGKWRSGVYWNHIDNKGLLSVGNIQICRMQFRPAAYSRQAIGCTLPCPNGGSCYPDAGTGGGYQCICAVGYSGWRCEDSTSYDGPTDMFIIIFFLALIVEALATYGMCMCWLQRRRRAEVAEEETHQLLIMTKQCESWDKFVVSRDRRISSARRASRVAPSWHSLRSWQLALDYTAPLRRCSAYRTMDCSAPRFQRSRSLSDEAPLKIGLTKWQALTKAWTTRGHRRHRRSSR